MNTQEDLFGRLEQLNEIGAALSSERDIDRLLEQILLAAKQITAADGGTLYRLTPDRQALRFTIMRNDSLMLALGGTTGNRIDMADLPLRNAKGEANVATISVYAAINACTVNIADAYEEQGFDFSGMRKFDEQHSYRSRSFLTVPMQNHEGEVIALLQLINALDTSGIVRPFSDADQRLVESLASQAAMALSNRHLVAQFEELFESFINLINLALDEKSPYTGGHCQRVPALTMMLAEAASASREGPLADFRMTDADRYELKIAGLLHDCGKVTTPVHVVDKATKLETIFDRIELIDTRFEVLKRDVEIDTLQRLLAQRGQGETATENGIRQAGTAALQAIEADRAFLRHANIGSETMSAADQQRVRDIGSGRRWRNADGVDAEFLSADEIDNLTIRSGTLTAAERQIVNYHSVATNKMLEELPWPRHLRNVPEYAGGHHERMDGKGYPKGLTGAQMSVPARIMGIADIFEALTARDRPYKSVMTLSEAIHILGKFKLNGHIDPDLFDIFVSQKVYLHYAEKFLDPRQIDAVDESAIPGYRAAVVTKMVTC
jgi:HD-GYP domain-containing protein (c-di-GMP phosphodiesterase class II)